MVDLVVEMSGNDGGNGGATEDKKPGDQSAHINLKVKGQVSLSLSLSLVNFL